MEGKELDQFVSEVIKKGPEAILPQNLSDRWLDALLKESGGYVKKEKKEGLVGLMLCVLILNEKMQGNLGEITINLSQEESHSKIETFIINLSVEDLSRKTGIELIKKPTIKDILDRKRELEIRNIAKSN